MYKYEPAQGWNIIYSI